MSFRAVVFDLYQTLVAYDSTIAELGHRKMAAGIGVPDAATERTTSCEARRRSA